MLKQKTTKQQNAKAQKQTKQKTIRGLDGKHSKHIKNQARNNQIKSAKNSKETYIKT